MKTITNISSKSCDLLLDMWFSSWPTASHPATAEHAQPFKVHVRADAPSHIFTAPLLKHSGPLMTCSLRLFVPECTEITFYLTHQKHRLIGKIWCRLSKLEIHHSGLAQFSMNTHFIITKNKILHWLV